MFNVQCSGLTNSNYTELSQLYEKYKNQGLRLVFANFSSVLLMFFEFCLYLSLLFCSVLCGAISPLVYTFVVNSFYWLLFYFHVKLSLILSNLSIWSCIYHLWVLCFIRSSTQATYWGISHFLQHHFLYTSMFFLYAGLEILAFPCNQFGAQEPGTNEQILEFACTRFKAEFPIFDKVGAVLVLTSCDLVLKR